MIVCQVTECSYVWARTLTCYVDMLSTITSVLVSLFCLALCFPITSKMSAKCPNLLQPHVHLCATSGEASLEKLLSSSEEILTVLWLDLKGSYPGVDAFGSCWGGLFVLRVDVSWATGGEPWRGRNEDEGLGDDVDPSLSSGSSWEPSQMMECCWNSTRISSSLSQPFSVSECDIIIGQRPKDIPSIGQHIASGLS